MPVQGKDIVNSNVNVNHTFILQHMFVYLSTITYHLFCGMFL